jgi:hypothetical protein
MILTPDLLLTTIKECAIAVQYVCKVQLSVEGQANMKAFREGNERLGEETRKAALAAAELLRKIADNIKDVFDGEEGTDDDTDKKGR